MIPPSRRAPRALAVLWLLAAALATASATRAEDPATDPAEALDAMALGASLEQDRERLIELIRRAPGDESAPLADDPELREIAERMPRTQDALRAERERTSISTPSTFESAPAPTADTAPGSPPDPTLEPSPDAQVVTP